MAIKKEIVNWTFNGDTIDDISKIPSGALGFIYRINLEDGTGRYYIGRKTIIKPNYKSGINKGKPKGVYVWKTYNGSSKELIEIIKSGVPYSKHIIKYCYSKSETSYEETKAILCGGALTDPLAFNFWVKATIYSKHLKPNT